MKNADASASAFLLFIIAFVAACGQDVTAGTFFVACQRSGLTGPSAHNDEHIHPRPALGVFHLRKPGRVLAFMTTI